MTEIFQIEPRDDRLTPLTDTLLMREATEDTPDPVHMRLFAYDDGTLEIRTTNFSTFEQVVGRKAAAEHRAEVEIHNRHNRGIEPQTSHFERFLGFVGLR